MANAKRSFSKYDPSGDQLAAQVSTGLPSPNEDAPTGTWERLKLRYTLDTGHNTFGRQIIGSSPFGDTLIKSSCRWRAMREATRVLLAAKIFASMHGGRIPADTSGFIPILGAWPTDPFNGKPMLYNATKQVVYSVGENLADDGGQVGRYNDPDTGVSFRPIPEPKNIVPKLGGTDLNE